MLLASTLFACCLLQAPNPSATPPLDPSSLTLAGDEVVFHGGNDPGIGIYDFLRFVEQNTDLSFTCDPVLLSEIRVHVIGDQRFPKADLFERFQDHLRLKFVALLPLDSESTAAMKRFAVVPTASGPGTARPGHIKTAARFVPMAELDRYAGNSAMIITTSLELKHSNSQEVVNLLQAYFTDPMIESARASQTTNAIVLTGWVPTILAMRNLAASVDTEPTQARIDSIALPLQHISAAEAKQTVGVTLAQPNPNLPSALSPMPTLAIDERTNSLIVTGNAANLASIRSLIATLDKAPSDPVVSRVVTLKHAVPAEIQATLSNLESASGNSSVKGSLTFVAHGSSKMLIVRGPQSRVAEAIELIDQLDVSEPR